MAERFQEVSAGLLCGGTSERLGFPKEMLRVDGAPLAVRMVERLKEIFDTVFVVSNRPRFLQYRLDAPVYGDEFEAAGPLAGIHVGLRRAGSGCCFFLACDMPLVHNDLVRRVVGRALGSRAHAVVASVGGRMEPLCGVYSRRLLPLIEERLAQGADRSVLGLLEVAEPELVEVDSLEGRCFRDVDTPDDVDILREVFDDVEPLPVTVRPVSGGGRIQDVVVEEWPVAVHVNSLKLVTVLCLPTALGELAVGVAAYLGLVGGAQELLDLRVDYGARRVMMQLPVGEERIRRAAQLLVTSTCGANVYGPQLPVMPAGERPGRFRVARTHLLECMRGLRAMAPVFSRTGGTHEAAFSDGRAVRLFFEDIGRHNAVDKVVGRALLDGLDMRHGVLVTTGRLSSEMVVKAVRQRVPILASRSAVTANAVRLAERYGLTLVGFARGKRLNVYTGPERVTDA